MRRTVDFLDQIKEEFRLTSDYQLAKKLGASTSTIYTYRANKSFFDNKRAFQVAEILDTQPAYVVACVELERAIKQNNETAISYWEKEVDLLSVFDKSTQTQYRLTI